MTSVLVHYQEIALKGRNRPWFLQRLVQQLRGALADLPVAEIITRMGRLEIVLGEDDSWPAVRERLTRVFGVANFARARRVALDLDALTEAILRDLPAADPTGFRIAVRRADKRFPLPSPEVERRIGRAVQDRRGWRVKLSHPDLVIGVEMLSHDAFYYFDKQPGPGGMPTGSSGRVMALLSGGIDSPVAAWRMLKRGCVVAFVHFHSYPFLSRTSQDKARDLVRLLTQYQLRSRLHLVPFGELQRQVTLSVPGRLRVIVYRRLMLRIAERLAQRARAHALITGEVVGQVASQTIENMSIIAGAATLPVFRPLIGFDKQEITVEAHRLGTYPISIVPDEDCCTLFTPRHPATRARAADIAAAEQTLAIDELVGGVIGEVVVESFEFPGVHAPISGGPGEAMP